MYPLSNLTDAGDRPTYKVNEITNYGRADSRGPQDGLMVPERMYNEGWRFCVAYIMLFFFSLLHFAFQKLCCSAKCAAINDNGKVDNPVVSEVAPPVPIMKAESASPQVAKEPAEVATA